MPPQVPSLRCLLNRCLPPDASSQMTKNCLGSRVGVIFLTIRVSCCTALTNLFRGDDQRYIWGPAWQELIWPLLSRKTCASVAAVAASFFVCSIQEHWCNPSKSNSNVWLGIWLVTLPFVQCGCCCSGFLCSFQKHWCNPSRSKYYLRPGIWLVIFHPGLDNAAHHNEW
jgi:hypothetical protein